MKNFIIGIVLLVLLCSLSHANAQSRLTDEQKQELKQRYQEYKEKLNLTEEQQPKVQEINAAFFEDLSQLKDSNDRKLAKYKKYKTLRSETNLQMKEVLTEEQYQLYLDFQDEMKETFKENRQN